MKEQLLKQYHTLVVKSCDFEQKSRTIALEQKQATEELEQLKESNTKFEHKNGQLKSELEELKQHCSVLRQQNKDLNVELDKFVQTDEQIRRTLNRKDRVETLRSKKEFESTQKSQHLKELPQVKSGYQMN